MLSNIAINNPLTPYHCLTDSSYLSCLFITHTQTHGHRHTDTHTDIHLQSLCSVMLWYSLCPCLFSSNVYDPFSKACTGIWWSVSFQVCIQTCNLTVWVMLPMDSLPTDSLSSSILCPHPMDKNDWWSPLLIYQIIDLLWHRFLIKLALSKICSGHQEGTGLKHYFCW